MKRLFTILYITISFQLLGQDCPTLNINGTFEEVTNWFAEPMVGISANNIQNWQATHGSVDYLTPNWNWYGLQGIGSNVGHMCYGNREIHNHSEGMYTEVDMYSDDDLVYSMSFDYSSICDSDKNGFLHVALNNDLKTDENSFFEFPTQETYPAFFNSIQSIDRIELNEDTRFNVGLTSHFSTDFIPVQDFSQIWFYTEYMYEFEGEVNCGVLVDNVSLSAMTTALRSIDHTANNNEYTFQGEFTKELEIESYTWSIDGNEIGTTETVTKELEEGAYIVCLDIIDNRGACGSACSEIVIEGESEETEGPSLAGACTYSSCLDLGGVPNITSFSFVNASGEEIKVSHGEQGFHFPYCIGTGSLCNTVNSELEIFVEDLNAFFLRENIDAKAMDQFLLDNPETVCRSIGMSITSKDITPIGVELVDLTEQFGSIVSQFDFNQDDCTNDIQEETEEQDVVSFDEEETEDDAEANIGSTKNQSKGTELGFEVMSHMGNQISILTSEQEQLSGGMYDMSGNLVMKLSNIDSEDSIDTSHLIPGMYVLHLGTKKYSTTKRITKF